MLAVPLFTLGGCAHLYRTQIDEIDSSQGTLVPIDVEVGDLGVDYRKAGQDVQLLTGNHAAGTAGDIAALFQVGFRTGNPTLDEKWADSASALLLARCPGGRLTGLVSRREAISGGAISGEKVHITGYCIALPSSPAASSVSLPSSKASS